MGPYEFDALRLILQECETNPDKTLFLMDNSEPGCPYIEVPLGDDYKKDGKLIIHADGWFIDKS